MALGEELAWAARRGKFQNPQASPSESPTWSEQAGQAPPKAAARGDDYETPTLRAAALKMANVAPCGSAMTEMRPTFSKSVAGI